VEDHSQADDLRTHLGDSCVDEFGIFLRGKVIGGYLPADHPNHRGRRVLYAQFIRLQNQENPTTRSNFFFLASAFSCQVDRLEPSVGFHPVSVRSPLGTVDLANEKHLSVIEIVKLWTLSEKTIRKIFESEPSVIHWSTQEKVVQAGNRTLRVTETILHRVHRRLRRAS
jgi:hypothetical protein